jgi:hypothetical protein
LFSKDIRENHDISGGVNGARATLWHTVQLFP